MAVTKNMLSAKTRKTLDAVESGAEIHPRNLPRHFEGLRDDVAQVDKADLSFTELTRLLDTALALGDLLLKTQESLAVNLERKTPELSDTAVPILMSQVTKLLASQEFVTTTTINSLAESLYAVLNVVPADHKKKEIVRTVLDKLISQGAAESTTDHKRRTIRSRIYIKHVDEEPDTKNEVLDQLNMLAQRFIDYISLDSRKKYRTSDLVFIVRGYCREMGFSTEDKSLYNRSSKVLDHLVANGYLQVIYDGKYRCYITEDHDNEPSMPAPDDETLKRLTGGHKTVQYDEQFKQVVISRLQSGPIKRSDVIEEFIGFLSRNNYSCSFAAIEKKFPSTMVALAEEGILVRKGSGRHTFYILNTLSQDSSDEQPGNPDNTIHLEPAEDPGVAFSESLLEGLLEIGDEESPDQDAQTPEVALDDITETAEASDAIDTYQIEAILDKTPTSIVSVEPSLTQEQCDESQNNEDTDISASADETYQLRADTPTQPRSEGEKYKEIFLQNLYSILQDGPASSYELRGIFCEYCTQLGQSITDNTVINKRFSLMMKGLIVDGKIYKTGNTRSTLYYLAEGWQPNYDESSVDYASTMISYTPTPLTSEYDVSINDHGPQSDEEIAVAFSESLLEGLVDPANQPEVMQGNERNHEPTQEVGSALTNSPVITTPITTLTHRQERTRLIGEKNRHTSKSAETYLHIKIETSGNQGTVELENGESILLDWFDARVLLKILQAKSVGIPFNALLTYFKASPEANGTRLFNTIVSLNGTVFANSSLYIESLGKANPQVRLAHKVAENPQQDLESDLDETLELPNLTKEEALPHIVAYVATTEDYDDRIDEVASTWLNKDVDALLLALNDRGVPIDSINATRIELVLSSAPGPVHKYGTQLLKQAVAEHHARNF